MQDLGPIHRPLTGLIDLPSTPEEWAPHVLSAAQVEAFERDGFLLGVRVLSDAQLEALDAELEELMTPGHAGQEHFYEYHSNESEDPARVLFHALGAWRVRPAFHDVLWSPALRMAAYQLLGASPRFFHDQLFAKPARNGGVVAWHQDYAYWTWTAPMAHLTCWMALDDVDEGNGCLRYVRGSHRWGLLERPALGGDMAALAEQLDDEQRAELGRSVPVRLRRGQASFHHPLLVHGSHENRSGRPRRATLVNLLADGVRSNMTERDFPGTTSYPRVAPGDPMGGEGYPLLLDEGDLGPWLRELPRVGG